MALEIPCTGQELIDEINDLTDYLNIKNGEIPIEVGGTGANNTKQARENLEMYNLNSYFAFVAAQDTNTLDAAFGKNNEDLIYDIGRQMAMYAWFKGVSKTEKPFLNLVNMSRLDDMTVDIFEEIVTNEYTRSLVKGSPFAIDKKFVMYTFDYQSMLSHTETCLITVTEEDLERPFYFGYYLDMFRVEGTATLSIGTVTYSITTATSDPDDRQANSFSGLKEWHELGITTAGEYELKLSYTEEDTNGSSSRCKMGFTILKMKG